MKQTDTHIFFYGGIYSQWYNSSMTIDGIRYNCCEQYMMHQKALLFRDLTTAAKIMNTSSPKLQNQLGREVINYNDIIWDSRRFDIVFKGNLAKFSQNELLKSELLNTGNRQFVEASPYDTIWGIGMGLDNPLINDPTKWRGLNLLGQVLTFVRDTLRK
jgi:ribA/ribD-fused uncharacterized protein